MAAESSKMGASRAELEVGELLSKLQLSDEEKDGVVLAKADRDNLLAVKWMAAAKLLTSKDFSVTLLLSTHRHRTQQERCLSDLSGRTCS